MPAADVGAQAIPGDPGAGLGVSALFGETLPFVIVIDDADRVEVDQQPPLGARQAAGRSVGSPRRFSPGSWRRPGFRLPAEAGQGRERDLEGLTQGDGVLGMPPAGSDNSPGMVVEEALRCLKRRLPDIIYRTLHADLTTKTQPAVAA